VNILVQKYGGTSVNGPDRIRAVAARIAAARAAGHAMVVVVSAMGGETDRLLDYSLGSARGTHSQAPLGSPSGAYGNCVVTLPSSMAACLAVGPTPALLVLRGSLLFDS